VAANAECHRVIPRNLRLSLHDLPPAYEFGQPNFARVFYGALFILVAALAALFFCLFVNFVVNSPLLVYAVRIAPGAPFSTTNEARVLIGSSGLVTAATMR